LDAVVAVVVKRRGGRETLSRRNKSNNVSEGKD